MHWSPEKKMGLLSYSDLPGFDIFQPIFYNNIVNITMDLMCKIVRGAFKLTMEDTISKILSFEILNYIIGHKSCKVFSPMH